MKIHYTLHYTLHYTRCNASVMHWNLSNLCHYCHHNSGVITSGQKANHTKSGNNARVHIHKKYRASRVIAILTETPPWYITVTPSVL